MLQVLAWIFKSEFIDYLEYSSQCCFNHKIIEAVQSNEGGIYIFTDNIFNDKHLDICWIGIFVKVSNQEEWLYFWMGPRKPVHKICNGFKTTILDLKVWEFEIQINVQILLSPLQLKHSEAFIVWFIVWQKSFPWERDNYIALQGSPSLQPSPASEGTLSYAPSDEELATSLTVV